MSVVQQREIEVEGLRCTWIVNLNSARKYNASIQYRDPPHKVHISVCKELHARPIDRDSARRLCDELLPEFIAEIEGDFAEIAQGLSDPSKPFLKVLAPEHLSSAAKGIERGWGVVDGVPTISLRQKKQRPTG